MNTLITISVIIVAIIVAIIIVAFIIKLCTGRNKRHADKTVGEKFASFAVTKVSSTIDDILNASRTPEAIKEQLLAKIKSSKDKLKKEFKIYLTELITAIETHKKLISNNESRLLELKEKARNYKKSFVESNDEKYRTYANRIIVQILSIEKLIENSKQMVDNCTNQQEEAEINYDLLMGELETKYAEIISMTMNPEIDFNLSTIDIADLAVEFKEKMSQRNIQTQVSNIVNKSEDVGNKYEVSNEELDDYFKRL